MKNFLKKLMVLLIQKMLTEAAKVLIHHFMLFSDERITLRLMKSQTESYDEESLHMRQLLKTKLVDMDLCKSIKLFESG
jgi:DNA-directed RNA polymerase subunit alpha